LETGEQRQIGMSLVEWRKLSYGVEDARKHQLGPKILETPGITEGQSMQEDFTRHSKSS
jgi:hypothetical protein